jgi:uncharacterized protein DUF3237
MSSISLLHEFFYRVRTNGPLPSTKGSPFGERSYWVVSEAEITGARIRATLAAPGSDWMFVHEDGFWRPDVHAPFKTDDGETVLMHYTGLVEQTDGFKTAAEVNRETHWEDQYMRLALRFDTGAQKYRWLNQSLFVARGRLLGTGHIEYDVYRVA